MDIGKKFLLISCGITLVCFAGLGLLCHTMLEREIHAQYHDKAEVLLHSMKAVRNHFRTVVRPAATRLIGRKNFSTALQSTSFAVRGVFQRIPQQHRADMDFRIVSTKPLNADSMATPLESQIIAELDRRNADGLPLQWSGVRNLGTVPNYIIAVGEANKPHCLRCHSSREAAPEELRNTYDFSSPPRLAERVESAEIVYIPMTSVQHMITRADTAMLLLGGLGLLLITSAMYVAFAAFIKRPVTLLREHADAIASGDLDHRTGAVFRAEFAGLKTAMDSMVSTLKDMLGKTAEQKAALQEKHSQLTTIIDSSADLIHFKDTRLRYLFANKTYETMFGVAVEDIIGKQEGDFLPQAIAEQCRASDTLAMNEGSCTVEENLDDRCFLTIKKRVDDADGVPIGLVGVIRDITGRKETQQLELEKARAEAASNAKTDFLAIMSHEIRTPMNVMLGMLDLLDETGPSREQTTYLASLRRSGEHLMDLINDVLDFSKIEAGEVTIRRQPFALESVVDDVLEAGRVVADEKGLSLRASLDVPAHTLRTGDAQRLMQVLMNLVSNAVKFTESGEVALNVRPARDKGSGWLVFSVSDTGIGIPADKIPRIFDAFTQADSDMNIKAGGTGLGLAICKRLVELMGGAIWISSTEGRGTTVSFRLPLPPLDHAQGSRETTQGDGPSPLDHTIRVLLAEDMEDNRALVASYLADSPVDLDFAENGEQAVQKTAETAYDLVLMDIRMPGMDGIEATRRIRLRERKLGLPPVPIVALTAHAFTEFQDQCMAAGCTAYITKPISKNDLLRAISAMADPA